MKAPKIELLNMDCMDYMAECEDNAFDLAIVDPPYGVKRDVGISKRAASFKGKGTKIKRRQYVGGWDNNRPSRDYFKELFRVSDNQIIWGGNFFADLLPQSSHWIFWDKKNTMPSFGDGELAWTSSNKKSVKKVDLEYNGLLGREISRIHPTQKPVKLYSWLMENYAIKSARILDTHLGSGSSAIGAHYFGCEFVGTELDPDYFAGACERFDNETRQASML